MYRTNHCDKELEKVEIDNTDLEALGIYLEPNYILSYSKTQEIKEQYIDGRDMPLYEFVRNLPIKFSLQFNVRECLNIQARIENIETFFSNVHGKIMTFNNEKKGFKLHHAEISNISRSKGDSQMTISFICYPTLERGDGN